MERNVSSRRLPVYLAIGAVLGASLDLGASHLGAWPDCPQDDAERSLGYPIATTDPLAAKLWSKVKHMQQISAIFFQMNGMMAADGDDREAVKRQAGAAVIRVDDFGKGPGDTCTLKLIRQLTRSPRTAGNTQGVPTGSLTYGSTPMVGHEEPTIYMDVVMRLEMLKNSTGSDTPAMVDLRSSTRWERDAPDLLETWLTVNVEELILDAFYDGYSYHVIAGGAETVETHANIEWAGNATSQATIAETHELGLPEIRKMATWLRVRNINPIMKERKGMNCLLVGPRVFSDLKEDTDFLAVAQHAGDRGRDNPLFTDGDLIVDNIVIKPWNRIRVVSASATNKQNQTERCLLLGAKGAAIGYGSQPMIVRRNEHNYRDRDGFAIKQIVGTRRAQWQTANNATTLNQSSAIWHTFRAAEY